MSAFNKTLLSLAAYGGCLQFILWTFGLLDDATEFLEKNPGVGIISVIVFMFFSWVYYHSAQAAAQIEFDRRRKSGKTKPRSGFRK